MKRRHRLKRLVREWQGLNNLIERGGYHVMHLCQEILANADATFISRMEKERRRDAHKANRKRYTT